MTQTKLWNDCTPAQQQAYLRTVNAIWGVPAKARAEKFLDEHNPAMFLSSAIIIAPSAQGVERAAFVDLLAGKVVQP